MFKITGILLTSSMGLAFAAPEQPNIIMIMADDLGHGDISIHGQSHFETPNIDGLAHSGARFSQFYVGAPVCSPSRSSYVQGVDTGHSRVRGNANYFYRRTNLRLSDVTVAETLREAGYQTALIGKWHLGIPGSTGNPMLQGFDYWFGKLSRERNDSGPELYFLHGEPFDMPAGEWDHDYYIRHARAFIEETAASGQPFFLNLTLRTPHASEMRLTGDTGLIDIHPEFAGRGWPDGDKRVATMIRALDDSVGEILGLLDDLDIAGKTIVFFTSDNGPHAEGGSDPEIFDRNGPLRGIKRDMYEGGIKVPGFVRWPGHIRPGLVIDTPAAFLDLFPTMADFAGAPIPDPVQGLSLRPGLEGRPQPEHAYLYWEFSHSKNTFKQAVRVGGWKGVRTSHEGPLELYYLPDDPREQHDVSGRYPRMADRLEALMKSAREDNPEYFPGVEFDIVR